MNPQLVRGMLKSMVTRARRAQRVPSLEASAEQMGAQLRDVFEELGTDFTPGAAPATSVYLVMGTGEIVIENVLDALREIPAEVTIDDVRGFVKSVTAHISAALVNATGGQLVFGKPDEIEEIIAERSAQLRATRELEASVSGGLAGGDAGERAPARAARQHGVSPFRREGVRPSETDGDAR